MTHTGRSLLARTLGVVAVLLLARTSAACSCASPLSSATELFASADAVFIGRLVDEQPDFQPVYIPGIDSPKRWLEFVVTKSWKGITGTKVGLVTAAGGSFAGCGFYGKVGNEYLVFAWIDADNAPRLSVGLCSFLPIRESTAEIAFDELDSIANRKELTGGPDARFPPIRFGTRLCGLGVLPAFSFSLLILTAVRARNENRRSLATATKNTLCQS